MEHLLACYEHGFAALQVPSKIMVDNLKSAVLQRPAGAAPVFNPRYLDFARHHGFAGSSPAMSPFRGNEKGRVESGVGYVKKNFLHGPVVDRLRHDSRGRTGSGSIPSPTCASTAKRNSDPSICRGESVRIWDQSSTRTPTTLHTLRPVSPPASSASPWTTISIPSPSAYAHRLIDGQSPSRPGLHGRRQPSSLPVTRAAMVVLATRTSRIPTTPWV